MGTKDKLLAMAVPGILLASATYALPQNWTLTSAPITNWTSVASSADGTKLLAATGPPDGTGALYVSTNSGITWLPTSAPTRYWISVASSAEGNKLIAAAPGYYSGTYFPSGIYLSTNAGVGWTGASMTPVTNYWTCVGSSADGSKLVVADRPTGRFYPSRLFASTNSGSTWAERLVSGQESWHSLASSANGTKWLFAPFYSSSDCAQSWVQIPSPSFARVASAADGQKCVGAIHGIGIYSSTNSGAAWTITSAPEAGWTGLASSADGTSLVAVADTGAIYTSTNSGTVWTPANAPLVSWSSVASSADGCKAIAVVNGGGIYTWQTTPTPALSITPSDSSFRISWIVPSMPFVLQENADLTTSNWTDVTTKPILNLTNLHHEVSVSLSSTNRFYRLKGL